MYQSALLVLFSICLITPSWAEALSLEEKLQQVRVLIEDEQVTNAELRAELAARETEVTELKLKLRELEDRIAALKLEHEIP